MQTPSESKVTALVPIERARIDLGRLHEYQVLRRKVSVARSRYLKLYDSVLKVANLYFDQNEQAKTVVRLRREIRMATKGTPVTIAQEAITTAGYVSFGTERLFNAELHLLKAAYRTLAPLVHPDRGGDADLFAQVNAAYHLKDMVYLRELYVSLTKDNLFYRSSDECREYLLQELERPVVSTKMLKNTAPYRIAQLHNIGRKYEAGLAADHQLMVLVFELQAELTYMLTKTLPQQENENHGSEEKDEGSESC